MRNYAKKALSVFEFRPKQYLILAFWVVSTLSANSDKPSEKQHKQKAVA